MKISIKRGAAQIGGSAVELTANSGQRLIIDIGLPLDAQQNTPDLLPDIQNLTHKSPDLLGVLISHPHQDHYALGKHIDSRIPVYMGKTTHEIMNICVKHNLRDSFVFKNVRFFKNETPFFIGPFKIKPFLTDHSAADAYSFLIECDGKRVFYSGDFRAHGRKKKLFNRLVNHPPKNIDVLLMEGSCLGRESAEKYKTEEALEKEFITLFKQAKGLTLIQTSSQNIDRIVSLYRAAVMSGKTLVMSGYTGHILMAFKQNRIPNFTWPTVKKLTKEPKKEHELSYEQLAAHPEKYIVILGGHIFLNLKKTALLNEDTTFIYSMWNGYKPLYQKMLDDFIQAGATMRDLHTSGHADIPTLQKLAAALSPKKLVPIHTFDPQKYKELFANVCIYSDNESFEA